MSILFVLLYVVFLGLISIVLDRKWLILLVLLILGLIVFTWVVICSDPGVTLPIDYGLKQMDIDGGFDITQFSLF